jgi:predicted phage tail protein
MASSGLLQAKAGASDDIKSTTGQYDSSLGATSNERSGKAIMARERQTDTGTYHYVDNLARAIRHITRQIIGLVPKIYDTQRVARIMGEDGAPDSAKIDPTQQEPVKKIIDQNGIEIEKIYNPSVGTYDVMVTTGPSYMTKRQEALESMGQLLQGNPQLWSVAGDLFIKNMDWPGAQEMAKRFAKTIDPKLMDDGNKDPALQAAEQQMQAMAKEMEQLHSMLQNVGKSIEMQDQHRKDYEAQIKAYQAETQRISAVQNSLGEEQISEIVMGTLHAAMATGDIMGGMPQHREMPMEGMEIPEAVQKPNEMQPPPEQIMQQPPMEQQP